MASSLFRLGHWKSATFAVQFEGSQQSCRWWTCHRQSPWPDAEETVAFGAHGLPSPCGSRTGLGRTGLSFVRPATSIGRTQDTIITWTFATCGGRLRRCMRPTSKCAYITAISCTCRRCIPSTFAIFSIHDHWEWSKTNSSTDGHNRSSRCMQWSWRSWAKRTKWTKWTKSFCGRSRGTSWSGWRGWWISFDVFLPLWVDSSPEPLHAVDHVPCPGAHHGTTRAASQADHSIPNCHGRNHDSYHSYHSHRAGVRTISGGMDFSYQFRRTDFMAPYLLRTCTMATTRNGRWVVECKTCEPNRNSKSCKSCNWDPGDPCFGSFTTNSGYKSFLWSARYATKRHWATTHRWSWLRNDAIYDHFSKRTIAWSKAMDFICWFLSFRGWCTRVSTKSFHNAWISAKRMFESRGATPHYQRARLESTW